MMALALWALAKWLVSPLLRSVSGRVAAEHAALASGSDERKPLLSSKYTAPALKFLTVAVVLLVFNLPGPPRQFIADSKTAIAHVYNGFGDISIQEHTSPARYPESSSGVVSHVPDMSFAGYNVEVSSTAFEARLLDMEGHEIHKWKLDRNAISRAWVANGNPTHDLSALYWRRVKPMEDGSLLVMFDNSRITPYSLGIAKLDWDSNLIWSAPDHYHHALDVAPDGKIYTLFQALVEESPAVAPTIDAPYLDDGVAILDSSGRELRRISLVEALVDTPYSGLLEDLGNELIVGDPAHMNTMRWITAGVAKNLPFANEGDLLLSIRNISTVLVLRPESGKVVWAKKGPWFGQHDPVFSDEGTLILFDNHGLRNQVSRIVEWDVQSEKIVQEFSGDPALPIYSDLYGTVSYLPNGNRLLSSAYDGRAIEFTPEGETVWEWRTDRRFGDDLERVGNLMEMVRVPLDYFNEKLVFSTAKGSNNDQ